MPRLTRVRPRIDPGYGRVRVGSTFRYTGRAGRAPSDEDVERISALVIPPAWEDVWISADPLGHVQVIGRDAAGRQQYIYHARWGESRDRGKFARAYALAAALPVARARVTKAIRADGIGRERVLAVAFRLLDEAAPRVGSSRYLSLYGSRGLTTLLRRDASVEASHVTLTFPAKSGKRALLEIEDPDLAVAVSQLQAGQGNAPLLAYRQGRRRIRLTPVDVNDHIRMMTGGPFTAKDFRTLRGTIVAASTLAEIGTVSSVRKRKEAELQAVRATAAVLGNTPAVARRSYIDPRIFGRFAKGQLLDLSASPEVAIRRLLGERVTEG